VWRSEEEEEEEAAQAKKAAEEERNPEDPALAATLRILHRMPIAALSAAAAAPLVALLGSVGGFSSLPPQLLPRLLRVAEVVRYPRRSMIVQESASNEHCYVVLRGAVDMRRLNQVRELSQSSELNYSTVLSLADSPFHPLHPSGPPPLSSPPLSPPSTPAPHLPGDASSRGLTLPPCGVHVWVQPNRWRARRRAWRRGAGRRPRLRTSAASWGWWHEPTKRVARRSCRDSRYDTVCRNNVGSTAV